MTRILYVVAAIAAVTVSTLWFFFIEDIPFRELTTAEAVSFATYFGGVMTPIVAFLSLAAFLRTLKQQQAQIDALKLQSHKSDLLNAVEQVEHDYEAHMNSTVIDAAELGDNVTAHEVASNILIPKWHWEKLLIERHELERQAFCNDQDLDMRLIRLYHCFGVGAGHLNQLRICVQEHDRIADNNVMTKYYARKYGVAFERFMEQGWLDGAL